MSYTIVYGTGFGMNEIPLATLEEGITGDVAIESTEIHTASYGVKVESDGNFCYAQWKPCADKRSYVLGLWVYPVAGTRIVFTRDTTSSYIYSLRYDDVNETWDLYQASTKIQDGKKTVTAGEWSLLEIVAYLGNDPFSPAEKNYVQIKTKVDKELDIHYHVFEDRAPDLIASTGYIQIGTISGTMYFDDITMAYGGALSEGVEISDSYFPGDIRYTTLAIDTESEIEWDPSTGADNAALIDETPFSNSDYNSTTVDEETDLFTFDNLDSTLRDIQFVGTWFQVWANDSVNAIYAKVKSNGTTETESLGSPGTSPVFKFAAFEDNPDSTVSGGVWSATAVNAATIGYESNITSGTVYVGAMLVECAWIPKVLSTYSRAGGFDVKMDIPVLTDGKWAGLLTDVAMVEDATITGSVVAFKRDGSDIKLQLLEYPGYAVTRTLVSGADATKAHSVRVIFHDSFISVYMNDNWIVTFAADLADYDTENTVSLLSDDAVTITNVVKSELYAWREGIYVEMETSGMSAIQSALQGRPIVVKSDADGKILFTYGTSRDSLNTGKPRRFDKTEQESPQAASDAIVYADEVFALPNDQYDTDVGWQTRVFRMFELGGDARFAAQLLNRQAIERQTMYRMNQRPDLRIEVEDEVTVSDTVVSHSGETIGDTFVVESVTGRLQDGNADQTVNGRKKVF